MGRVDIVRDESDSEHLDRAVDALDRMETLIEEVLALARHGQPVEETQTVSLSEVARESWEMVEAPEAELVVESDLSFEADVSRLGRLLENLFRNAVDHAGSDVTVTVGRLDDGSGFYLADDGPGIPDDQRDTVLETGYSTTDDGTGFGLAIVAEIADAHGWTLVLTESAAGGLQVEISDV